MHQDVLDPKVTRTFAGKVVRKDLLHQIKGGENVPSYVLEYLLGKYCASDDEDEIRIGIEAVKETLRSNYFRHDEANKAQSLVEQRGTPSLHRPRRSPLPRRAKEVLGGDGQLRLYQASTFLTSFTAATNACWRAASGPSWTLSFGRPRMVQRAARSTSPILRPIQLARFDFDEYIEGRQCFSRRSGSTSCCAASVLSLPVMERRLKLLLLTRFIPFVEKNYNFIELGPTGNRQIVRVQRDVTVLHPDFGWQGEHGQPLLQ